ncbi:MAG: RlmE family RNA methyltransferase [Hyphomicrobiaceae bacterium]
MAERLKTARGRTPSQQKWLRRQLNDPYVAAAREQGYRSRAAFKLAEIDARYKLLKRGMRVLDLGATPGGWSQVAARKVGVGTPDGGTVLAVDINEMAALPGVSFLQQDFLEEGAEAAITAMLGGAPDAVLSDMAAPATGHRQTDHLRIMALCEAAAAFAMEILAPGGFFLCKVLQGGAERSLLEALKQNFAVVRHVKPPASRADSAELYVLATGFRGRQAEGD